MIVSERFVYDPEQVCELVSIDAGDVDEASAASSCCGPADGATKPELDPSMLEGKVASLRFSGRRPL